MLGRPVSLRRLFTKRIPRLIVSLVFWSIVYAVVITQGKGGLLNLLGYIVDGFGHSWFIYMILGLYLLIPLLTKITESQKATRYFLALSLAFAFIIPRLIEVYVAVTGRSAGIVQNKIDNMYMFFPLGYSGYFVLGYYITNMTGSHRKRILIIALSVLVFISVGFSYVFHTGNNVFKQTFKMGYLTPTVLIESIAVFVFLKNHCELKSVILKRVFSEISECSFGIYLIHILVMNFLLITLDITKYIGKSVISMLFISLSVFSLSLLLTMAIKRIPILKNYII